MEKVRETRKEVVTVGWRGSWRMSFLDLVL